MSGSRHEWLDDETAERLLNGEPADSGYRWTADPAGVGGVAEAPGTTGLVDVFPFPLPEETFAEFAERDEFGERTSQKPPGDGYRALAALLNSAAGEPATRPYASSGPSIDQGREDAALAAFRLARARPSAPHLVPVELLTVHSATRETSAPPRTGEAAGSAGRRVGRRLVDRPGVGARGTGVAGFGRAGFGKAGFGGRRADGRGAGVGVGRTDDAPDGLSRNSFDRAEAARVVDGGEQLGPARRFRPGSTRVLLGSVVAATVLASGVAAAAVGVIPSPFSGGGYGPAPHPTGRHSHRTRPAEPPQQPEPAGSVSATPTGSGDPASPLNRPADELPGSGPRPSGDSPLGEPTSTAAPAAPHHTVSGTLGGFDTDRLCQEYLAAESGHGSTVPAGLLAAPAQGWSSVSAYCRNVADSDTPSHLGGGTASPPPITSHDLPPTPADCCPTTPPPAPPSTAPSVSSAAPCPAPTATPKASLRAGTATPAPSATVPSTAPAAAPPVPTTLPPVPTAVPPVPATGPTPSAPCAGGVGGGAAGDGVGGGRDGGGEVGRGGNGGAGDGAGRGSVGAGGAGPGAVDAARWPGMNSSERCQGEGLGADVTQSGRPAQK